MNYEEVLDGMLEAAASAAKGHWKALRGFAREEFSRLSEAAVGLEADYLADWAEAQQESDRRKRTRMETKAKRRAELAFENLKLAGEGVIIAARADAKLAAQDAVNAAMGVLRGALNKAIGIALV